MLISTMTDMILGMILGMVASPIMMKAIKSIRQKRKVNKILREAADQQEKKDVNSNVDQRYRIL
jgi:membrane protease subunit (stomatin/prohibitin family)